MSEIRIPTQKRSIEKREKIIEKGFELMCNNGYFNTNTSDIAEIFHDKEIITTQKIVEVLNNNGISSPNLLEKVHILIGIVENYCHEVVYHKHSSLNYDIMKKEVINIITNIIK